MSKWVAAIDDSPKPPPRRITLTFLVLNTLTRHVIFCGAGESKSPIVKDAFNSITYQGVGENATLYRAMMNQPAPFPSGMVSPNTPDGSDNTLTWIVDADAMKDVPVN
jgi:6-phosphogluconolactonase